MDISVFPTINASLNGLAGVFLYLGYRAVKKGNTALHRQHMVTALICSALFLACYLTYHYLKKGLVTRYEEEGVLRIIYLAILISHTILAAIVPPAAITAVVHAVRGNFVKHIRITRWLYPVWIYVSITGVIVYLMLYVF